MTQKHRFLTAAVGVAVLIGGAQLALASGSPQRPVQAGPVTTSQTLIRNGNTTVVGPPLTAVGTPLSTNECKGLGGVVATVFEHVCASGQKCVVADKDGVVHSACITATAK